jgi:ComF family protein
MSLSDSIEPALQNPEMEEAERPTQRPEMSHRIVESLRRLAARISNLMLPPLCVGCETRLFAHDTLCPACWRGIDFIRPPLCDRLGIPLPYDTGGTMVSAAAVADPPDYERARAVARYSGLMRDLVHELKYRDALHARALFGRWLHEAGQELIAECDVIVAVPLARGRLTSRRFNQSQLLANEIARLSGKPTLPLALVRTRATRSQVGLSRAERRRNVAGAFAVRQDEAAGIAGKRVLLVDDVVTTGATASAAARALKKSGAAGVDVLALCLTGETPVAV